MVEFLRAALACCFALLPLTAAAAPKTSAVDVELVLLAGKLEQRRRIATGDARYDANLGCHARDLSSIGGRRLSL